MATLLPLRDDGAGRGPKVRNIGQWARLAFSWRVQVRVIRALMIRELITRFGRENIGFLWMMAEPLLFASLVGTMWTLLRGGTEHGSITTSAFIATGYIPLTLFRHSVSQAVKLFSANSSLMYHRQVKILDIVFVRFLIEFIGALMAFLLIGSVLHILGLMPIPVNPGYLLWGLGLYGLFTLSLCLVLAPLSEKSDVLEKLIPVTTYIMIPFSGTFTMNAWLTPKAQEYMIYSPFVDAVELIRYGVFGDLVTPIYNTAVPLIASMVLMTIGLMMCRRARRTLVIE